MHMSVFRVSFVILILGNSKSNHFGAHITRIHVARLGLPSFVPFSLILSRAESWVASLARGRALIIGNSKPNNFGAQGTFITLNHIALPHPYTPLRYCPGRSRGWRRWRGGAHDYLAQLCRAKNDQRRRRATLRRETKLGRYRTGRRRREYRRGAGAAGSGREGQGEQAEGGLQSAARFVVSWKLP